MVFPTSICFGWQAISILQSLCACLIIPVSFPPYSWPFFEYITILRQCSDISLLTLNVHYGPRDSKQQGQVVQTSKRDFFSVWMVTVLFYRKMEMQLFSCLGRRNSLMLVFSVSEGQQPAQKKKVYLMFCCQNDSVHNTVEYKWSVYRMKITLSELWGPTEAVSLLIRWFMFMRENGNTVWNEFLPVRRLCICFVKKDSVNLTSRRKPILFIRRVNYGLKLCCTRVDILHGFKSGQRSS